MLQEMRPPRFYLALILWSLLAVLTAIVASGAVLAVINERKLSFMIAFVLATAFERGGDLLIAAWLFILAASWNWMRFGRWRRAMLTASVAAIVAVSGTLVLVRFGEGGLAEWWRADAPLRVPAFLLAVGLGVGVCHAAAVVRLFARVQKHDGSPIRLP